MDYTDLRMRPRTSTLWKVIQGYKEEDQRGSVSSDHERETALGGFICKHLCWSRSLGGLVGQGRRDSVQTWKIAVSISNWAVIHLPGLWEAWLTGCYRVDYPTCSSTRKLQCGANTHQWCFRTSFPCGQRSDAVCVTIRTKKYIKGVEMRSLDSGIQKPEFSFLLFHFIVVEFGKGHL